MYMKIYIGHIKKFGHQKWAGLKNGRSMGYRYYSSTVYCYGISDSFTFGRLSGIFDLGAAYDPEGDRS